MRLIIICGGADCTGLILVIVVMLLRKSGAFQSGSKAPLPPHLGWLDSSNNPGTQKQCNPHGGPSSLQMTTQSNQENDARISLDYQRIQNELGEKSSQSVVNINVDGKIFSIKN